MKILWFSWKDREHPLAGGAELLTEELLRRFVRDGHEVILLSGGFKGCAPETSRHGIRIIRVGGRLSVYWKAYQYYKKNLVGWADQVVEEINTIPFFASLYTKTSNKDLRPTSYVPRTCLFIHQLAREIWFYEMFFPLSLIGYLIEPIYLWVLRKQKVITVSESTKKDLIRFGFKAENISIISEGIEIEPVADLSLIQKTECPAMLALGSIRAMKRTLDIVKAFEIAKKRIPELQLWVAGGADGAYGQKVLNYIKQSLYAGDIEYFGRVSVEKKIELMQKSHVICFASVKEGWCLVVTEAASQGTPAVVYDVDGLRDSVRDGVTGIVCKQNTPSGMADSVVELLNNQAVCASFARAGWEWSKEVSFERGYEEFEKII